MPSLEVYFLKTKSFVGMTSFEAIFCILETEQMSKYVSVLEKGLFYHRRNKCRKGERKEPHCIGFSERHQCELLTSTEHIFTCWV